MSAGEVTVLFLGRLGDLAGSDSCAVPAPLGWSDLLDCVPKTVADELRENRIHIACGGRVLSDKTRLTALAGDEVALLPPVSGG